MKHDYIKRVFTDLDTLKQDGILFSGIRGEGEYKKWHSNGQLLVHSFQKNGRNNGEFKSWHDNGNLYIQSSMIDGKFDGEYKEWFDNGKIYQHRIYKKGDLIKDYLK